MGCCVSAEVMSFWMRGERTRVEKEERSEEMAEVWGEVGRCRERRRERDGSSEGY
jgi:hypothetical protein